MTEHEPTTLGGLLETRRPPNRVSLYIWDDEEGEAGAWRRFGASTVHPVDGLHAYEMITGDENTITVAELLAGVTAEFPQRRGKQRRVMIARADIDVNAEPMTAAEMIEEHQAPSRSELDAEREWTLHGDPALDDVTYPEDRQRDEYEQSRNPEGIGGAGAGHLD